MNVPARIGIVFVLLLGATLFIVALVADPPVDPEPEPAPDVDAATPSAWAPAKPGVLDDPKSCRKCHPEIYDEWMEDRHSQAWRGALFTELSKNHSDPNCWSCHAPRPILETGLDSPAEARKNFREEGITCLTCHKRNNHVVGPIRDPGDTPDVSADCGPAFDPRYPADRADLQEATIAFCGVCHNLHGTHKEFMGSQYFREGKTCLSCHMEEEVMGPVATGGRPRLRRVHRMPGAHSLPMLQRAMRIEAERKGDRLVARVVNEGAGHRIPTDARHRAIYLLAAFFDAYGQPVPVTNADGNLEREVALDLIRLFYRHEQRDPTQVDPAGTLGKDNWRESSIAIPAAARGGRVRLRLYYHLRPDRAPNTGTLVEEKEMKLDE